MKTISIAMMGCLLVSPVRADGQTFQNDVSNYILKIPASKRTSSYLENLKTLASDDPIEVKAALKRLRTAGDKSAIVMSLKHPRWEIRADAAKILQSICTVEDVPLMVETVYESREINGGTEVLLPASEARRYLLAGLGRLTEVSINPDNSIDKATEQKILARASAFAAAGGEGKG